MENEIFTELYRRYYSSLFLYAYSLTRNRADAEDLTANTFVKALTTFQSGNIRAWLYTVLHNEFLDYRKSRSREVSLEEDVLQSMAGQDDVWEQFSKNERYHWLYRQISLLPGLMKEIMLLTLQTNWKDSEIAAILGITTAHVRVLRHRAKTKILDASKEESL